MPFYPCVHSLTVAAIPSLKPVCSVRDRMRTAVGQARLLMKERFKQFTGLVDDCEFARGEKITTCTDLQGFWDMVYYQASSKKGGEK